MKITSILRTLRNLYCVYDMVSPIEYAATDSDHFIYCSAKFQILVSGLINSMFIHGYTPIDLLESVLISIPKDLRGNTKNYRGIALCSALCQLVDFIIIDKSKLVTSELQYAFKTGHSTNMCTSALKEVWQLL